MLNHVGAGDTVWDVGANIGRYSARFSRLVGSVGWVFAYEPSPHNQLKLRDAVALLAWPDLFHIVAMRADA
jgi:FkbM family methyltransferase